MNTSFLKKSLSDELSSRELQRLIGSFDVIGDIAVIKVPSTLEDRKDIIAEAIMEVNKNVKTVLQQVSPVKGVFRLRKLEYTLGERKTETLHREHGCVFKVDLAKVYFSPRLSYERMRIGRLAGGWEVVLNLFAGVGCFSIIMAKHSRVRRIYSVDLNPEAVLLMIRNISLNRVGDRLEAVLGDAREVVEKRFGDSVDRVLMPLPGKAYEYLDAAIVALNNNSGVIHYYDTVHASREEDPEDKLIKKVGEKLDGLGVAYEVAHSRVVRPVGPFWYQIALDIAVNDHYKK